MEEEFENRFWRPHFIVTYDTTYNIYSVTLHEVHYENNVPVNWTTNPVSVSAAEEDLTESINQAKGLLDIYATASKNVVYKEYHYKDDDGEDHVRLEEIISNNYNVTRHDGVVTFDFSTDEKSSTIGVDLDEDIIENLNSVGIDLNTPEGLDKMYDLFQDFVDNPTKYIR